MSRSKAIFAGILAGLFAGIALTVVMLLFAWALQIATPLVILGDRLSVFISPKPFFWVMGKVGGYNHLKQLGVSSSIFGQLVVGMIGGAVYGLVRRKRERVSYLSTFLFFVLLPLAFCAALLWPVLGTHYGGLPIAVARLITLLGLLIAFLVFERLLVLGFDFLTSDRKPTEPTTAYSPKIGRRGFLLGAAGILLAGGGVAIARRLFRLATFSYDGTQYLGPGVQPITPNDQFYCVTKNIVDPRVDEGLWHLEITGLVQNPRTYRLQDLRAMSMTDQETTLMCISNGLDAGLMSNAVWQGIPMGNLLLTAGLLPDAKKVRMYGVDNYSDTIPIAKAKDTTTLIAFKMNGEDLPDRHGFPARVIVPGYFGEKHVKWLTRIELTGDDAKGFYEAQGWGPNFIVPTRSRIDVPANESWIKQANVGQGLEVRGVAFGGNRGVSKVELSFDDGESWEETQIAYPGTKLTWALWSYLWQPEEVDDYSLTVRATDGDGAVQMLDENREFTSGISGFHKIMVHIFNPA